MRHSRSYGGLKKIRKLTCPNCGLEDLWGVKGRTAKCPECKHEWEIK